MTAKVGRSEWDSHLINQYRQERDEARAEIEYLQNGRASDVAHIDRLQAELDQAMTKLRYALAALEKSTNLMNDLLYDPSMEIWHDKKIIYQIAENQAMMVLQPTEIGEK